MMVIRCSKLARVMACAGSMFLNVEDISLDKDAANEGTAAGEYLTGVLLNRPIGQVAQNGVFITDEMKFFVNPIAQNIFDLARSPILSEQRIDWQTRSGIWIRGQYDASYVDEHGRLCIDDLKYGWGLIEVEMNWQLIGYAIGEVIRRGQSFSSIVLRICQPRPHHEDGSIREWIISYDDLLKFKEMIEVRMEQITKGDKRYTTGPQCKYCPGTAEACTAFNNLFNRSLEVSRQFVQDKLSNDEISKYLDQAKRAKEVIEIKYDSLVELGVSRIKNGEIIPGYIQTNRYGNRSWKPEVTPDSIRVLTMGKIDPIEKSFMSPAKVEKLGINKVVLKQLTVAPLIGVKLEKKNATEVGNKIFGTNNPVKEG